MGIDRWKIDGHICLRPRLGMGCQQKRGCFQVQEALQWRLERCGRLILTHQWRVKVYLGHYTKIETRLQRL